MRSAPADFIAQYTDGTLQAVNIVALPQHGTLSFSGQALPIADEIAVDDLGNLLYQPAADFAGEDSFQGAGFNGQGYSAAQPFAVSVNPAGSWSKTNLQTWSRSDAWGQILDREPASAYEAIQVQAAGFNHTAASAHESVPDDGQGNTAEFSAEANGEYWTIVSETDLIWEFSEYESISGEAWGPRGFMKLKL